MKRYLLFPALAAAFATTASAQLSFISGATLAGGDQPDHVAFGDFDLDGDQDLAVTSDNPDRIEIWANDGTGNFTLFTSILTGANTGAGALKAADLDGDGKSDLAVALHNVDQVAVYRSAAGPGFSFTLAGTVATGASPESMDAGDVDGDGDVDLATSNRDDDSVTVALNDGGGVLSAASTVTVGSDLRGIVLADFGADGMADVAVSSHDSREVYVMTSTGGGGLGAATVLSVGANLRPEGITAGDVDGNGFADLAVSTSGNGFNFATVFANSGASFGPAMNWPLGGVDPDSILVIDLDGDGDLDLVTADQSSNAVSLLENNGAGSFGAAITAPTGVNPGGMDSADVDGDGDADLATANRDSNSVSVLVNTTVPAGATIYCIAAPNSAGAGAHIGYTGTLSVATGDFTVTVTGAPASQFGLFFYGPNQLQVPFGDGFRCVGGGIFRLGPASPSDAFGESARLIDFTGGVAGSGAGQITGGSSWNFQYWYRDPLAGLTGMNLSDALAVNFLP